MAAAGVEKDEDPTAVLAARILVSFRHRKLLGPPEWVQLQQVPEGFPKRQRSRREKLPSGWKAELKLGYVATFAGSGACSSGEDGELSPPRASERSRARPAALDALMAAPTRRPGIPLYYGAPAGSGPWTSAADRAAQPLAGEKAAAQVSAAASLKESMTASSPETPLDFGVAAAGSNASSSGDDAKRPPPKRKVPGARRSAGGSSGDEGCSSPAKRTRVDDAVAGGKAAAVEEKAISAESKMQSEPSTNGGLKFAFDLNIPWTEDHSDIF
ncbi:uncharacterized protein LOC133898930 [Phragmites australis]|uniref:uncharacterized protein LOC133898930 n=1 Tax=Phragmites australis TaxID=29695 RepID=UPI002D76DCBA|nr:uncharacterized protein LOC133898930 [Phragmites australis]